MARQGSKGDDSPPEQRADALSDGSQPEVTGSPTPPASGESMVPGRDEPVDSLPEAEPSPSIWSSSGTRTADRIDDAEVVYAAADAASEASKDDERAAEAQVPEVNDEPAPPPPDTPAPAPVRRGGLVPMVLGGVIAAGIGYGAAYLGYLPVPAGGDRQATTTEASLQATTAELAALQAQVADLASRADLAESAEAAPGSEAPGVDLSPVLDQIAEIGPRIDETTARIEALTARVVTLEERPVISGDPDADTAAALEAAAQLEAELAAEREDAAARAADLEAIRAEAEAATVAAEEAAAAAAATIAQAEAEAAAGVARAAADAALGQVRVALETGEPFAEPLAALAAMTDVAAIPPIPEPLAAVADSGVATLGGLQAAFPPLARTALPVALQETAGEGVSDRVSAFVRGQVGGRSVEPREGSDPDAVLSRIEAAIQAEDLPTVLAEAEALPAGAQDVLAPWLADVEARAGAEAGLIALTDALSGSGN